MIFRRLTAQRRVQQLIRSDYNAGTATGSAVFLLGHVPVLMSGDLGYDSHGARAMPADGFYGDMTEIGGSIKTRRGTGPEIRR